MHQENRELYGSPRVHRALLIDGESVSRNTVAKLMRQANIRAKSRRRFVPRTTDSTHRNPVADNLLERDFTQVTPSHVLFEHAPLTEAEQVVEAVLADAEQARLLEVAPGSALLMVSRRTVSQGAVASVARLYHPGARYRLIGRFAV